jgi:hypothetical protein
LIIVSFGLKNLLGNVVLGGTDNFENLWLKKYKGKKNEQLVSAILTKKNSNLNHSIPKIRTSTNKLGCFINESFLCTAKNYLDSRFFNREIEAYVVCRVELLPTFKFTGKTVKNCKFTDNYR